MFYLFLILLIININYNIFILNEYFILFILFIIFYCILIINLKKIVKEIVFRTISLTFVLLLLNYKVYYLLNKYITILYLIKKKVVQKVKFKFYFLLKNKIMYSNLLQSILTKIYSIYLYILYLSSNLNIISFFLCYIIKKKDVLLFF